MKADLAPLRSHLPATVPEYIRRCFTIDTRSLAVFRILAGILIIADVLSRSRSFSFYYTDDGAISQSLAELYTREHAVSVFFWTEDPTIIAALFVIHALVGVILIFGYKTRWMLIISLLFVVSLDHHNPFNTSYADTLFRMLLFWAIFLPLGERWSIDALQRERAPRLAVANIATAAIMIQMVYMYTVNALHKYGSDLWHSGESAIIVMGIDEMTFFLGNTMRNVPLFLQIGGRMWFYLLVTSVFLILLYGRARYPYILALAGGHASFAITVRIGAFPYVAILGLITFLQPRFWADARAILSVLGVNWFPDVIHAETSRAGRFIAERIPGRLIEFPARDLLVRRTISVVVVIAIIGVLVWPAVALAAETPYVQESPLPDDGPLDDMVSNWNVPQPAWSIFAGPDPRSTDRYYVFPAKTADGQIFDLRNERPMTYDRPGQELQRQHSVYRERFYMNSVRRGGDLSRIVTEYGDYLCNKWEEERGVELTNINMYEVREQITLETIDSPEDRDYRIFHIANHACGDNPRQEFATPEEFGE